MHSVNRTQDTTLDIEQVTKILNKIHTPVVGAVQLLKVSLLLSIITVFFNRLERVGGRWLNNFMPIE
jgi:hypothetical protein